MEAGERSALLPTCSSKLRRVGAGTYLTRSDDQKMMRGVGRFRSLRAWPSVVGAKIAQCV